MVTANDYRPSQRRTGTPMLKVATIAGSAHFIMLDQPAAFQAALRAGLGQSD